MNEPSSLGFESVETVAEASPKQDSTPTQVSRAHLKVQKNPSSAAGLEFGEYVTTADHSMIRHRCQETVAIA